MARVAGVILRRTSSGSSVNEFVHLGQHGHSAGVNDGGDRGDEGVAGDDYLVARPEAQAGQGGEQSAGATVHGDAVAHAEERLHLALKLIDLGWGVLLRLIKAVATELPRIDNLEDLPPLILTEKIEAWAWQSFVLL